MRMKNVGALGCAALVLAAGCGRSPEETPDSVVTEEEASVSMSQAVPGNEPREIKSTFMVGQLERFKPLPPRSTLGTPDPESEEVKARMAARHEEEARRKAANIERVAMNRGVAAAWLNRMKERAAEDPELVEPVEQLTAVLLPSPERMGERLKERQIATDHLTPDALEREYRRVFAEELKKEITRFSELTEKTGL